VLHLQLHLAAGNYNSYGSAENIDIPEKVYILSKIFLPLHNTYINRKMIFDEIIFIFFNKNMHACSQMNKKLHIG
jgi:hypothetical protein